MVQTFDDGIWCSVEWCATNYEENTAGNLVRMANFSRERCLELAEKTSIDTNKVMKVLDFELEGKFWS